MTELTTKALCWDLQPTFRLTAAVQPYVASSTVQHSTVIFAGCTVQYYI